MSADPPIVRGRRAVGVDSAAGFDTTVVAIHWPDGDITIESVQRQPTYAEVEARYQRIRDAIEDGSIPFGPPWQSRPGPGG